MTCDENGHDRKVPSSLTLFVSADIVCMTGRFIAGASLARGQFGWIATELCWHRLLVRVDRVHSCAGDPEDPISIPATVFEANVTCEVDDPPDGEDAQRMIEEAWRVMRQAATRGSVALTWRGLRRAG